MFEVSVIIPVYNAEKFIEEAVQSATQINEVKEVILIEDGSKDNSLKVCFRLIEKYPKVILHTHQGDINKGAAESRNLGIKLAKCDFIAFLDADDWYLPNRFETDKAVFNDSNVFATYSLSLIQYPNGEEELFGTKIDLFSKFPNPQVDEGEEIYKFIIQNDLILGHTNSNTFRKSVFEKINPFDVRLVLHQDTELWNRIAKNFIFYPSNLKEPISVARRHSNNRITHKSSQSQIIHLLVWIDNIGLEIIRDYEAKAVIYHLARMISNGLKPTFMRKSVLHGFQWGLLPFRGTVIKLFYKWGIKKFKFLKE
ncbi:MAG: glycosyltransferase family 2 protein [Cyclobacteriaceae bacterium]